MIFIDGQWRDQRTEDPVLSKTQCQMWIILYELLLNVDAQAGYELNSARRASFLKLQGSLGERELNQVPSLEPLARWMSHLAMIKPQTPKPLPLVTTITQVNIA